jgi:hypothetical protein
MADQVERFELVPRGPFTLASAARSVAGWAPDREQRAKWPVALRFYGWS